VDDDNDDGSGDVKDDNDVECDDRMSMITMLMMKAITMIIIMKSMRVIIMATMTIVMIVFATLMVTTTINKIDDEFVKNLLFVYTHYSLIGL